jgi:hypothetical protein
MRWFARFLIAALAALVLAAGHQSRPDWWWRLKPPPPAVAFAGGVRPFVARHCYECHDSVTRKGDFALDRFTGPDSWRVHREAWERVLTHVQHGLMPPAGAPQPGGAERARFLAALDRALHPVDPRRPDPGWVVVRRLNRAEYRSTVQDLFGVEFDPAADFPEDDAGYGFDHIGEVLTTSPLLFERYLAAARAVAEATIVVPLVEPRRWEAPPVLWNGGEDAPDGAIALYVPGVTEWTVDLPATGRYRLTVRVYEDAAGDEPARFAAEVDGEQRAEGLADAPRRSARTRAFDLRLERGVRTIGLRFLNDFYLPAAGDRPAQDRNFYLVDARLEGPHEAEPVPPSVAQVRLLGAPAAGEDEAAWIERTLARIARRAWRREVAPEEVARLVRLVAEARAAGDTLEHGFQLALQAMLVSPSFLFRGEPPGPGEDPGAVYPISEYALATRLSYFLWQGPPDDALLDLAAAGQLRRRQATEVDRLLADPRVGRFVESFTGQWLHLRNLAVREVDPGLYPEWTPELAAAMAGEPRRFFADFLRNGRPVVDLLTARETWVDALMAAHYGVAPPGPGEPWARRELPAGRQAGLLGQAAILTVTSYPNRTSPVLRGKFVLENLLGTPPPPPPPNIPSLDEEAHGEGPATLRGRLELHRSQPSCAACHALIDPIGFALDHYDALGRWRSEAEGQPVDSRGRLASGEAVSSPEDLAAVLAGPRREEFQHHFAGTLLTYALGRGLYYYDRPTVAWIVRTAEARGGTLPAYVHAVVESVAFQQRRGATPPAVGPDGPPPRRVASRAAAGLNVPPTLLTTKTSTSPSP